MPDEKSPTSKTGAASAWLICCTLPVAIIFFGHVAKFPAPAGIESAFPALVAGQIFFALFLWPIFERKFNEGFLRGLHISAFWLAGLLILSIPLVILARRTSDVSLPRAISAEALVFLIGMISSGAVRLPAWQRWFYPLAFVWSAVLPYAAYWLYEGGAVTVWAAAGTPFWAALTIVVGEITAPITVFATITVAVIIAANLFQPDKQA